MTLCSTRLTETVASSRTPSSYPTLYNLYVLLAKSLCIYRGHCDRVTTGSKDMLAKHLYDVTQQRPSTVKHASHTESSSSSCARVHTVHRSTNTTMPNYYRLGGAQGQLAPSCPDTACHRGHSIARKCTIRELMTSSS